MKVIGKRGVHATISAVVNPDSPRQQMRDFAYVVRYLYSALRWRLFVWLALIVLASALEGVTLGLFLPIIAGADSNAPLQRMFTSAFDYVGIEYTLPLALGAMTALYALRTVLVVTQEIFVARQLASLMVDIKSRMVDQLLKADYQYFARRGVGYFNNAATVEFTNLTNAFDYCTRAQAAVWNTQSAPFMADLSSSRSVTDPSMSSASGLALRPSLVE